MGTSTRPEVKLLCHELGRPSDTGVCENYALDAPARLGDKGIQVNVCDASVTFTSDAESLYTSSPWAADTPCYELLQFMPNSFVVKCGQGSELRSRIMRGLEALEAPQLH